MEEIDLCFDIFLTEAFQGFLGQDTVIPWLVSRDRNFFAITKVQKNSIVFCTEFVKKGGGIITGRILIKNIRLSRKQIFVMSF